jgi:hypothetical protein
MRDYYRRCRSCFRVRRTSRGGALETVVGYEPEGPTQPENSTGLFFREQTVDSLIEPIRRFESVEERFDSGFIGSHVQSFDVSRFKAEMQAFIGHKLSEFHHRARLA